MHASTITLATKSFRLACALGLFACAGNQSAVGNSVARHGLSVAEANQIIGAFETAREQGAAIATVEVKSLDDVLTVLKSDNLDNFPAAVKFLEAQKGNEALALHSQIELAWGEAQQILAELLLRAQQNLVRQRQKLEAKEVSGSGLKQDEIQELEALKKTLGQIDDVVLSLERVAKEHFQVGGKLARELIEIAPSDYHGYRVIADYYHLIGDWESFDQAVAKLEQTNPSSIGLLFARGMEQLDRFGDRTKAAGFFTKALERDPDFMRAEVQLLLLQSEIPDAYRQYQALMKKSPQHQIVRWAGPVITRSYQAWQVQLRRTEEFNRRPAAGLKASNQ
jgi:tetratricopeptide (TPR) repeat protein